MKSYYVDAINGLDTNNGLTKETSFKTLQKILDSVPTFSEDTTIYLQKGTYPCSLILLARVSSTATLSIVGLGSRTTLVPSGPFGANYKYGNGGAKANLNKFILDMRNMGGTNTQYSPMTLNFNNIAMINVQHNLYATFLPSDSTFTFRNCIATGDYNVLLRCDEGSIKLYNCYGRFTNGFVTSQNQWDIENNIITTVPKLTEKFRIDDIDINKSIGLYSGVYKWASGILLKQNGEYYSIAPKFYNPELLKYDPLPSANFENAFFPEDLFKYSKVEEINVTPVMTSDTTPAPYVASASSVYSTYNAWKAFDGLLTPIAHSWLSVTGSSNVPQWLQLDFGEKTKISAFDITSSIAQYNANSIKDFSLLGSQDGETFTILKTVTNELLWSGNEKRRYYLDFDVEYRYYRLHIDTNNANGYKLIGELDFIYIKYPEDSFAPIQKFNNFTLVSEQDFSTKLSGTKSNMELIVSSGDINLSVANNIDYFNIIESQLGNGELRIVLSVDGGVTWKTYSEGFVDLTNTIPNKSYLELNEDDKATLELVKNEISESGITVSQFNALDFNLLNAEKIKFAYLLIRPTYKDKIETDQLDWSFDAKGWMEEMQDSEGDFLSYDYSTRFKSNVNNEMIKLTAML